MCDLSLSLLLKGLGVILVNWNGILWHRQPPSRIYGFKKTSIEHNIPLIEISKKFEHVVQCLPQDLSVRFFWSRFWQTRVSLAGGACVACDEDGSRGDEGGETHG